VSQEAPGLEVRDRWDNGEATVTVRGEIDMSTAEILAARLAEVAGRSPGRLVVDLAGVGFMDSAGLHCLARVRRLLPEHCPLVIRSAQPQVRKVLELTGLATVCDFE